MYKLSKKVERLRAVLLTKKQSEELIGNLKTLGDFSDEDKTLMENFKKIYHAGVKQLKVFINLLEDLGKKVDEYTIQYYITQLKNGPFKGFLGDLVKGKEYWKNTPDTIGVQGNLNRSTVETPISNLGDTTVYDINTLTLSKVPKFILSAHNELTKETNTIYQNCVQGSITLDEQLRETFTDIFYAGVNGYPHGSYLVADTTSWNNTQAVSVEILPKVKEYLGDETYRLYEFNRDINLFDKERNADVSSQYVVQRISEYLQGGETKQATISADLIGNTFESDKVREFKLEIRNDAKNTQLNLYTVEGQLGDLSKPKQEPITKND